MELGLRGLRHYGASARKVRLKKDHRKRLEDELLLDMVKARAAGMAARVIAEKTGWTVTAVRTATNRVLEADRAESGEPVDQAYWR